MVCNTAPSWGAFFRTRFARGSLILVTLLVTACGGGGGDSSPPVPTPPVVPTPVPSATITSDVRFNIPSGAVIPVNTAISIQVTTANATSTTYTYIGKCDGVDVSVVGALSTIDSSGVSTTTPTIATGPGQACTLQVSVTASNPSGASPAKTGSISFTTQVPTCTPPRVFMKGINTCSYPTGTQVVGISRLPAASTAIGDETWKQAVAEGMVTNVDSGIALTGYSTRPVLFAVFKGPLTGNSCARLIYKDDGTAVDNTLTTEGECSPDVPGVDWVVGTAHGLIRHFPGTNTCSELTWNEATKKLGENQVTCPF